MTTSYSGRLLLQWNCESDAAFKVYFMFAVAIAQAACGTPQAWDQAVL